jgi:hypothetical protein
MKLEDITLNHIYDYIENGNPNKVDPAIVEYLDLIEKIRGMYLRFDKWGSKDAILKHLIKVDGHSRYFANQLYNDCLEYFYCDNKISKDAWRNIYAEKMERNINLATLIVKDVSDIAKVNRMIKEAAELRQLDVEEPEELPEALFNRPWKLYSMDHNLLEGAAKVDRLKLAQQIDALPELSEKEREIIKREAAILPPNIFLPDDENPRKS